GAATLSAGPAGPGLAARVAARLPAYAAQAAAAQALAEAGRAANPVGALEAGLLNPLRGIPAPAAGVCYLLIDALDEAVLAAGAARGLGLAEVLPAPLEQPPPL